MKKTLIILNILALIASSCGQATKKQAEITNDTAESVAISKTEEKYLIKNNGVDLFLIGQEIPTTTDCYVVSKSIETRMEEGEEYKVLVRTVSENGEDLFQIERLYDDWDSSPDRIDEIFILSGKYKTAENIGLGSTIEEFTIAYPDYVIWFSYVSGVYVIETGEPFSSGIQFFLDGNDFIEEGGPLFESDMTILKPSDFKKNSKIKEIRIWGYGNEQEDTPEIQSINAGVYQAMNDEEIETGGCAIEIEIGKAGNYTIRINGIETEQGIYEISSEEADEYISFENMQGVYDDDTIIIQNSGNVMNEYTHFESCDRKYIHFIRKQ